MRTSKTRTTPRAITTATLTVVACLTAGLASGFFATANAVEVNYVGTIRTGLSAPTSLDASADQIAALQPFSQELVAFTPDGTT